jgi:hypothetical protein
MPFAGIAFLWFADALRIWIGSGVLRENLLLSNIQVASGILFVGMVFAAAAAISVMAATVEFSSGPIDPMLARLFPEFGRTLLIFFALKMAAMFVISTANICRKAGILPRWFGFSGLAVGVALLLTPTVSPWLVVVFPVWVLVLAALLLTGAGQVPADATRPTLTPPLETAPGGQTAGGA